MKNRLKWFAGVLFFMSAIGAANRGVVLAALLSLVCGSYFQNGNNRIVAVVLAALLSLVCGFVLIPPLLAWIERTIRYRFVSWQKYAILFLCFLGIGYASDKADLKRHNPTANDSGTTTGQTAPAAAPKLDIKERIEKGLAALSEGVGRNYDGSVWSLKFEAGIFSELATSVKEGQASDDADTKRLAEKLKKQVIELQVEELPKMRKKYVDEIYEKLWEEDVKVVVGGSKNEIITFTGSIFATNKNIKKTQEMFDEVSTMLRFKEAHYKWSKHADEHSYYKLNTKSDSELFDTL